MKKIFCFCAAAALLSGCITAEEDVVVITENPPTVLQQGNRVVQAIIAENFADFIAGANDTITQDDDAGSFTESCKLLEERYGKPGSFRYLGELQTPLLVNQLFAVKFKKKAADGKTVEHEQLLQLIFGVENGKYKLLGMRFM